MAHFSQRSSSNFNSQLVPGSRLPIEHDEKSVEVVVVEPNKHGIGRPSLGFGLRMMESNTGINQSTLSRWIQGDANSEEKWLKLPSGKMFKVMQISDSTGNDLLAITIEDTFDILVDLIVNPGKLRKEVIEKVARFLGWFAIKGIYASTYAQHFGGYTAEDNRAISKKLQELEEENQDLLHLTSALSDQCDRLEQEVEESSRYYWEEFSLRKSNEEYSRYLEVQLDRL